MENEKTALRKHYKQRRLALSAETLAAMSIAIANRAMTLPIWESRYMHLFLSSSRHREIDTHPLLTLLQGKDKCVVVPKMNWKQGTLQHYLLDEDTPLAINDWGIPEPITGQSILPAQLEVVFVPLLAYDQKGNRLGYGKGFYDRFLAECSPQCWRIGLSCFPPEKALPAVNATDVPLHACITPEKIYTFDRSVPF